MYGWTHDHLLNHMSWAQIIMYYKYGSEIKYGKPDNKSDGKLPSAKELSYDELKAEREQLRKQYGVID